MKGGVKMANFSVDFDKKEKERFEEAFKRLKEAGCIKSKKELLMKAAYYVLLNDTDKVCSFWGQSFFTLEKKLQEKGGTR